MTIIMTTPTHRGSTGFTETISTLTGGILFTIILQSASVLDILIITAHIIIVLIIIALSITILFIMILSIMVTQDFMAAITDLTDTIPIIHTIPHTITEEAGVITLAYPMFPTQ